MKNLSNFKALSRNELRKLVGGDDEGITGLQPVPEKKHCGEPCHYVGSCVDTHCNVCTDAIIGKVCLTI